MKGRGGFGGGGGGGGMQNIMRQVNQLQLKMKKLQDELAEQTYEGTSGGGAVTAKMKGESKLIGLTISADAMKAGDAEMLQDMIIGAVNEAIKKAKETHAAEMEKITGGAGIPGMF
ncbi:MAG: YbaB/EbfC family nucleoid-associated protein [Bdellovibrionales bacterium]|jgi:DNA-binding YbaB/EbfC family protein|nr:YbaB/EbfC family nucleoid-associated protein [Bdellovibrionales bacterium]